MTSRLRTTFFFILFFLTASVVHAQNAGTTHVFPQIVDGVWSDGSAFTSRFLIASIGGFPAACNISLFGIGPERLTASASVLVQPASWETISTRGQGVIAAGYARLDCSQPVFASLTYSLQSAKWHATWNRDGPRGSSGFECLDSDGAKRPVPLWHCDGQ